MKPKLAHQGFTLVEIMIVVAIIALLTALALPSWIRNRHRSQATSTMETLRMLDGAIEQWAMDNSMSTGSQPAGSDIAKYVKAGSNVYNQLLSSGSALDAINLPIAIPAVGETPQVSTATFQALSDAAPASFWNEYYTAGS